MSAVPVDTGPSSHGAPVDSRDGAPVKTCAGGGVHGDAQVLEDNVAPEDTDGGGGAPEPAASSGGAPEPAASNGDVRPRLDLAAATASAHRSGCGGAPAPAARSGYVQPLLALPAFGATLYTREVYYSYDVGEWEVEFSWIPPASQIPILLHVAQEAGDWESGPLPPVHSLCTMIGVGADDLTRHLSLGLPPYCSVHVREQVGYYDANDKPVYATMQRRWRGVLRRVSLPIGSPIPRPRNRRPGAPVETSRPERGSPALQ